MTTEAHMIVQLAVTDSQVNACFAAMQALRPHLDEHAFLGIVRKMQRDGYQLAALLVAGRVTAVAGFRIKRTLFCDKFLYVDDLSTLLTEQSKGFGKLLLDWLRERARAEGCAELRLDSGLQRTDAHRFYQRNGVEPVALHFREVLDARVPWSSSADHES